MIVLDTHIWVWWVHSDPQLPATHQRYLQQHEAQGLGVSIISCWEVAKLAALGRLVLPISPEQWLNQALSLSNISLLDLTPRIVVESTHLPGTFHRDPADQLIVATARVFNCPLVTVDTKIRAYPHVQTAP